MGAAMDVRPRAGVGLFHAANAVLLLMGLAHCVAVINANFVTPTDPQMLEFQRVTRGMSQQIGPFHATAWGAVQILNTSYSILLLQVAALNWLALPGWIAARRVRVATWANLLFVGLLLAVSVVFQFPPPLVFAAAAFVLFAVSLARQRRGPGSLDR